MRGTAFYPCSIDGHRASIWLDTSVPHEVEPSQYPYFHTIFVYFNAPTDNGMPTDSEAERLHDIEDYLVSVVTEKLNAVSVGRNTTCGYRAFFFYAKTEAISDGIRDSILERFPDYEFSSGDGMLDPEWNEYFDCIYPNDLGYHYICIQRSMQDVRESRETATVDYYFYFDDKNTCESARSSLALIEGFETQMAAAAPLGQFRLIGRATLPLDHYAIYQTFAEIAISNDAARNGFTHCELDCDGMNYHDVTDDARLRVAADVDAGLRPNADLARFRIQLGPATEWTLPNSAE